jgi:hypothetical protein
LVVVGSFSNRPTTPHYIRLELPVTSHLLVAPFDSIVSFDCTSMILLGSGKVAGTS